MPIISYATKLGLVPGRKNEKWGQKKGFFVEKKVNFLGLNFSQPCTTQPYAQVCMRRG